MIRVYANAEDRVRVACAQCRVRMLLLSDTELYCATPTCDNDTTVTVRGASWAEGAGIDYAFESAQAFIVTGGEE